MSSSQKSIIVVPNIDGYRFVQRILHSHPLHGLAGQSVFERRGTGSKKTRRNKNPEPMFRSNWNGKPQGCANPSEAFCPEPCRIGTVIAAAFEARRAHAETPPRFTSMSSIIPREPAMRNASVRCRQRPQDHMQMPVEPPDVPPATPGHPTEPPPESPPGRPDPQIPPPLHEPGEPPRPDELPGRMPDEVPLPGPNGPPPQPSA